MPTGIGSPPRQLVSRSPLLAPAAAVTKLGAMTLGIVLLGLLSEPLSLLAWR